MGLTALSAALARHALLPLRPWQTATLGILSGTFFWPNTVINVLALLALPLVVGPLPRRAESKPLGAGNA